MTIPERNSQEQRQADVEALQYLQAQRPKMAISNHGELRRLVSAAIKELGRRMSGGGGI